MNESTCPASQHPQRHSVSAIRRWLGEVPRARGASTGPRTAEGLARSRRARWKHGLYSAEARAEQGVRVSCCPKVKSS